MKWLEKAADRSSIPEDVLTGWPRAVLYGQKKLIIEQHHGIITYQAELIRFQTACGVLTVEGLQLEIAHYGPMDAMVTGHIARLSYGVVEKEEKRR